MQCTALGTSFIARHFLHFCTSSLHFFQCTLQSALHIVTFLHCTALCCTAKLGCELCCPSAYSEDWRWELVGLKSKIQVSDDVSSENWNGNWTSKTSPLKTKSPKIGQSHPGRFPGSFNLWPLFHTCRCAVHIVTDLLFWTLFKNWYFSEQQRYKLNGS